MNTAAAKPKPIDLIDRRSATMKLANTHTMIAAAAVITRAVVDNRRDGSMVVAGLVVPLLDGGQQEHLVVHRRPKTMANSIIGAHGSIGAGSMFNTEKNQPHWKRRPFPRRAPIDTRFKTTAFNGTDKLRNTRAGAGSSPACADEQWQAFGHEGGEVDARRNLATDVCLLGSSPRNSRDQMLGRGRLGDVIG